MLAPQHYPSLVLNADFRPLSYFPLSLISWQEAVKAVFLERVCVVANYSRLVRSTSFEMSLPSVVSLQRYVPPAPRTAFTRFNVFLRDGFACQYCAATPRHEELTFDHVIPRSRGGRSSWDNVVTACQRCNLQKGSALPSECAMHPRTLPMRPSVFHLQRQGRRCPPGYLHESWQDFLYWDTELEGEPSVSRSPQISRTASRTPRMSHTPRTPHTPRTAPRTHSARRIRRAR